MQCTIVYMNIDFRAQRLRTLSEPPDSLIKFSFLTLVAGGLISSQLISSQPMSSTKPNQESPANAPRETASFAAPLVSHSDACSSLLSPAWRARPAEAELKGRGAVSVRRAQAKNTACWPV